MQRVARIAGRILTMRIGRRDVEVPATVYAPVDNGDHWRFDFTIDWPDKPRHGHGNGIDSAQALMIVLRFVGVELYVSNAHKAGKLKCPERRAGYGFPLPWTNARRRAGGRTGICDAGCARDDVQGKGPLGDRD